MPVIIPLRELKNASEISKLCHESEGPVFVTKNGASDLVVMSSSFYDELDGRDKAYKKDVRYDLSQEKSLYVSENSSLNAYHTMRDSLPIYSIAEIKQTLKPIFIKHKVKKAILFGSYVKGQADARSDIDLVLDSGLKGLAFFGLLGDISDSLRFPVDCIDVRQIEKGSSMEKEIEETGVTIYG